MFSTDGTALNYLIGNKLLHVILDTVTLEFPIYGSTKANLRSATRHPLGGYVSEHSKPRSLQRVRALSEVSFALQEGDRLGIVGVNGAGKSSLLKLIAGYFHPTKGSIAIDGDVESLIDPMESLDPELTGEANAKDFLTKNRLISNDIERSLFEILETSGLGNFFYFPVNTYSSGMKLRLAWSLICLREPEILLMDEVIGTGDELFSAQMNEKVKSFYNKAGILVLATHSPDLMRLYCNKALLLHRGQMVDYGEVDEVFNYYSDSVGKYVKGELCGQ